MKRTPFGIVHSSGGSSCIPRGRGERRKINEILKYCGGGEGSFFQSLVFDTVRSPISACSLYILILII